MAANCVCARSAGPRDPQRAGGITAGCFWKRPAPESARTTAHPAWAAITQHFAGWGRTKRRRKGELLRLPRAGPFVFLCPWTRGLPGPRPLGSSWAAHRPPASAAWAVSASVTTRRAWALLSRPDRRTLHARGRGAAQGRAGSEPGSGWPALPLRSVPPAHPALGSKSSPSRVAATALRAAAEAEVVPRVWCPRASGRAC